MSTGSAGGESSGSCRQGGPSLALQPAWGRGGGGGGGPHEPTGKGHLCGDGYCDHHAKTREPQGECLLCTHTQGTGCVHVQ